jgi:hypothetical protein
MGTTRRAVEKVFAETSLMNRAAQVEIGGGDDPGVGASGLALAHRLECFFLQDAKQLHLKVKGHIAHFVEEHRSARGQFESSGTLADRASEGPAHMSEEFALQ